MRRTSVLVPRPLPVQLALVGLDHVDEVRQGLLLGHGDRLEVLHEVLERKNDVADTLEKQHIL